MNETRKIITIDGKDYDLASLSQPARDQIGNVKATEGEINRLKMQLAIAQTARVAYAKALQEELAKEDTGPTVQ